MLPSLIVLQLILPLLVILQLMLLMMPMILLTWLLTMLSTILSMILSMIQSMNCYCNWGSIHCNYFGSNLILPSLMIQQSIFLLILLVICSNHLVLSLIWLYSISMMLLFVKRLCFLSNHLMFSWCTSNSAIFFFPFQYLPCKVSLSSSDKVAHI